ncbi:unnamed protein product, partial [Symbiodinium microadriaticum]
MRLAAAQVGRGAAAGTFTDMARAAGEEAGRKNLSSSSRWAAGRKSVKNAERDVNRALKRSGDGVPVQCSLSYVVLPIVQIRMVRRVAAQMLAQRPVRGRGRGRGRAAGRLGPNILKKKGVFEKCIVYKRWPVYLPHQMAQALLRGGAGHLLNLGVDWTFFWEAARNEMWGRNQNVVQEFSDECRKNAVPLGLHGDEGQGKKAIRSANLAWSTSGVNLTLEALQAVLVNSLKRLACPETAGLEGASIHYTVGKGDWKHKSSWLCEMRDYGNLRELPRGGASFCRRCNCGSDLNAGHWLDFQNLSFNDPGSVEATLDGNVLQSLPLHVFYIFQ